MIGPFKFQHYQFLQGILSSKGSLPSRPILSLLPQFDGLSDLNAEAEKTIIVIPSISMDENQLSGISAVEHYETRALWEILRAVNNKTKIIFLSSLVINDECIDHLLSSFSNKKDILKRISFLTPKNKRSDLPLTQKVLQDNELLKKLRELTRGQKSYINCFMTSPLENKLSKKISVPLLGPSKELHYYQTKSGNRAIFKKANVSFTDGIESIKSRWELRMGIKRLWNRNPDCRKMILKLDNGVSGNGNAILNLSLSFEKFKNLGHTKKSAFLNRAIAKMNCLGESKTPETYMNEITQGAVLEIFIEGEKKTSPSAQGIIHPNGRVEVISTHEQILDESGNKFLGSFFPADHRHRALLQDEAKKIGEEMATKGIIGPYAVDFLVSYQGKLKQIHCIEINLRYGGTTHPYQTAKYICEATYDYRSGHLLNKKGEKIYYRSNDNVQEERFKGLEIKDLIQSFNERQLLFNKKTSRGVVFHLLSALKTHGKFGYTLMAKDKATLTRLEKEIDHHLKNYHDHIIR